MNHGRMTHIAALAASLGKPVARGMLSSDQALATIARQLLNSDEDPALLHSYHHVLKLHVAKYRRERDACSAAIHHALKLLLAARQPSRQLLAQAHDINGERGFPLTENEVADKVRDEIHWTMWRAKNAG